MIMTTKEIPPSPLRVLHCDADILALDKPAGLAVHPGPRTPHSLEALLPDLAHHLGQRRLPVILHRLDRDTSGCLLLARHKGAVRRLAQLFEARQVQKTYWAILETLPATDSGIIDAPLAKISSAEAGWRMVVDPRGKTAITHWQIMDREARLIAFRPLTGRTHQLRVHANCLGTAIVGDPVYGQADPGGATMRLHARQLRLPLPDGTPLEITAPLPQDWPDLLCATSCRDMKPRSAGNGAGTAEDRGTPDGA